MSPKIREITVLIAAALLGLLSAIALKGLGNNTSIIIDILIGGLFSIMWLFQIVKFLKL